MLKKSRIILVVAGGDPARPPWFDRAMLEAGNNRELRKRLSKHGAMLPSEISVHTDPQQGTEADQKDTGAAAEHTAGAARVEQDQDTAFSMESMLSFTGYDGAFLSAAGASWNFWLSAAGGLLEPSTPATPRSPRGTESPALPRRRGSAAALSSAARRQHQYLSDSVALLDAFGAAGGGEDGATAGMAILPRRSTARQVPAPASPVQALAGAASGGGSACAPHSSPAVRKFERLQRRGFIRVESRSRSCRWYWFNRTTGDSVWERPIETTEWAEHVAGQPSMPPQRERLVDPAPPVTLVCGHAGENGDAAVPPCIIGSGCDIAESGTADEKEDKEEAGEVGGVGNRGDDGEEDDDENDDDDDDDDDDFEDAEGAAVTPAHAKTKAPVPATVAAPAGDLFAGIETLLDSPSMLATVAAPLAVPMPVHSSPTASPQSDPPVPQRFLNATKGDPEKAAVRWKATCDWRHENKIDEILQERQAHFSTIRKHYPSVFHGRSRKGTSYAAARCHECLGSHLRPSRLLLTVLFYAYGAQVTL